MRAILFSIGWLVFRAVALNAMMFAIPWILALARNVVEGTPLLVIRFPAPLYMISLVVVNILYIIGITFEVIHCLLWQRPIEVSVFEPKFFKISFLMMLTFAAASVVLYFISGSI